MVLFELLNTCIAANLKLYNYSQYQFVSYLYSKLTFQMVQELNLYKYSITTISNVFGFLLRTFWDW